MRTTLKRVQRMGRLIEVAHRPVRSPMRTVTPARSKNSSTWMATFLPFASWSRNSAAVTVPAGSVSAIAAAMLAISATVSLRKN